MTARDAALLIRRPWRHWPHAYAGGYYRARLRIGQAGRKGGGTRVVIEIDASRPGNCLTRRLQQPDQQAVPEGV